MANSLCIINRNLARITGVAASTTAGANVAANMLAPDKSDVWRAPGKTATLSGGSATLVTASCLHMPITNFSPTVTGTLTLWSDAAKTTVARTVGPVLMCPEPSVEIEGWAPVDAASAYDQGGGAWARVWFPSTAFRAWSLDIVDNGNLQGALEVAAIVIGAAWSPEYDVEPDGATVTPCDNSTQFRTAAGSLRANPGTRHDEMTLNLTWLTEADRKVALQMLRANGRRSPLIVSLWPNDNDPARERAHSIYGLLTADGQITLSGPDDFATKLEIASI